MANPLEIGSVSPPAPLQNGPQGQTAMSAPMQGQPPQGAPPPPPDHAQTVAALRHFDAIKDELSTLAKNPALGKSDVKSAIIDGVTNLVSQRYMKPAEAVIQLSQVPTDPIAQRKWVQTLLVQTIQAERGIIAHHAIGFAGQGPMPTPHEDGHMDAMSALQSNYGNK